MKTIQMVDLQGQYEKIKPEVDLAIQHCISGAGFINGPDVSRFKKELETYLNVNTVIPCANGTDALQIAMMALDLKPGDEVIVPAFTYVATAEVIALLGLTPVWVDVEPTGFSMDIDKLKAAITNKTKAIVPVHLYGQCADMERIMEVAKEFNLFVIEDTAQAIGATYEFKDGSKMKAGTIGTIGCTSFFPSKNLGCYGDGGALYTNDAVLGKKIQMIANHGQEKKYHHDIIGVNSRLDTLQAAILNVKLKRLDNYSGARAAAADRYDEMLAGIEGVATPVRMPYSTHVFHQYTLKIANGKRDELKKFLETHQIPSMVYYPLPMHLQKAYYSDKFPEGSYPVSEQLCKDVLSLPMHTELTLAEQEYIVEKIKLFFSK
jgi:UDP-2-acetamido-2-deoxy-ribo-hexuluronate aminotransferase